MLSETTYEKCEECLKTAPRLYAGHCMSCISEQLCQSADVRTLGEESIRTLEQELEYTQDAVNAAFKYTVTLRKELDDMEKDEVLSGLGEVFCELDDATELLPKIIDRLETLAWS